MSATQSFLSEAEIHGLVDGHIEADRRADVLRRAAASDADRTRIETWQDQADMIRAAFRGIEKEPVPVALDLKPPARVISLAPVRPLRFDRVVPPVVSPATAEAVPPQRRARLGMTAALTVLVVGCGLATAWFIADSSPVVPKTAEAPGTVEDVLAQRTAGVLAASTPGAVVTAISPTLGAAKSGAVTMPTSSIPDLTSVGFTLSGAEAHPVEPASLVFRYRNADNERIVIGVAKAPREWQRGLPSAGDVVVWRVGGKAYAIGGTLKPDRLRAIATSLRDEAIDE